MCQDIARERLFVQSIYLVQEHFSFYISFKDNIAAVLDWKMWINSKKICRMEESEEKKAKEPLRDCEIAMSSRGAWFKAQVVYN